MFIVHLQSLPTSGHHLKYMPSFSFYSNSTSAQIPPFGIVHAEILKTPVIAFPPNELRLFLGVSLDNLYCMAMPYYDIQCIRCMLCCVSLLYVVSQIMAYFPLSLATAELTSSTIRCLFVFLLVC